MLACEIKLKVLFTLPFLLSHSFIRWFVKLRRSESTGPAGPKPGILGGVFPMQATIPAAKSLKHSYSSVSYIRMGTIKMILPSTFLYNTIIELSE